MPNTPVTHREAARRGARPGEVTFRLPQVLLALAVVVVAYGGYRLYWVARVHMELDAIRDAGFPATLDEFNEALPPLEGPNAADLVSRAANASHDGGNTGWWPLFRGPAWPESVLEADFTEPLEHYLDENRQAIALLYEAASLGDARFDTSQAEVPGRSRPAYLMHVVRGANQLAMEAVAHAYRDRPEAAADALLASIAIGQTLRHEPSIIAQQVRCAAIQQSISALEWILPLVDLDAATAGAIREALVEVENPEPIQLAYVGTRCLGAWYYNLPIERQLVILGSNGAYPMLRHAYYRYGGIIEQDLLRFYESMNEFVHLAGLPPADRFAAFQIVFAKSAEIPARYPASAAYFRAMPHVIPEATDLIARARAARVLLALDASIVATGSAPD
ncbi:MAG: hypothetical protein KJ060_21815, partial [Candidatus Hydrogenedentes bacterium]|nr:hypothetical protein [Candidatus Hydrogenedentota bacterium]